jgi:hypothetical protein
VNTALPSVTGRPQAGQTLTSSIGGWANRPTGYLRKWRRCNVAGIMCADIAGATGSNYAVGASDVGFTICVVVTATNAAGSTSASSTQTAVVTEVRRHYWWRRSPLPAN